MLFRSNRRTLDGKHPDGWYSNESIGVRDAVTAYTRGSAWAAHRENELGALAPGQFADVVVLTRDILDPAEKDRLAEAKVAMTILGGSVVYRAP